MHCVSCGHTHFSATPYYYQWNSKEFVLTTCKNCGLITMDPKPTDEELGLLYADEYFETGQHGLNRIGMTYEQGQDKNGIDHRINAVKQNMLAFKPDMQSVFEIGFAMGHMLAAARDLGLEIGGIEFSPMAVSRAKEKFDIDALCGNFENIDLSAHLHKWDCVYGGDVFEHFIHPDLVVKNMHRILKDNGVAIVAVPSTFNLFSTHIATTIFKLMGKRKRFVDKPYHVFEYTPRTISALFKKEFREVQVVNRIKKPSQLNMKTGGFEYKIKYLIHVINYPFTKLFNRNGDRLLVVARK
ncbi:MAG TPA: class I SAM-dependent methyltransferase [Chitinophagales bacterium]|nr:class I SAM-dependent methyltransferase [Chitinophagales bacterium]HMZ90345.1 class I SAM-dependent methyltransferase [Chitinophagales bacterium]